MNELYMIIVAGVVLLGLIAGTTFLLKRKPKKLNQAYYQQRWQDLQKLCKDKATWPLAIIDADKLLDDVLKRSRYKGKTMGERLVAAQRDITSNDEVWFGHKLRNRLVHESNVQLTEKMVKEALVGIRSALKDLGAL
jgi:predicted Zn-dependent protease